jgi:hypothetical protein
MREYYPKIKHKNNPNPNAEMAFIIYFPFQYFVYKNIYKHLDNSEFVVDLGPFFPVKQPEGLLDELVDILKKNKAYYRILYHSDYYLEGYLKDFFSRYRALVSVWEQGCITLDCNLDKKKINLTYGAGKELTQVRFTRRLHDLILAFGDRDSKLFSLFATTKKVGNPKFDDWFNNELDEDLLSNLRGKMREDKKTVLYLPTHGDLCSIEDLAEEIKRISFDYNVLVKIHYHTLREEPDKVEKIRHDSIIILGDEVDLLTLLKISDVVVSDNSSAIFDAMLADKPVIATDFLSDEYLDVSHKSLKKPGILNKGAMTYSGSIEQLIKKEKKIRIISKPGELKDSIEKAISDDEIYKKYRKEICRKLFAFQDGKCGERAAHEIKKLLSGDTPANRPIMFHAIEGFLQGTPRFHFLSFNQRLMDQKRTDYLESIYFRENDHFWGNRTIFSIILLDYGGKFLERCLQSLLFQEFPEEHFEITVISGMEEERFSQLLENIASQKSGKGRISVNFSYLRNRSLMNTEIKKAVRAAKGDFVCFTKSNFLLSSKWMLDILLVFQKYPTLGAVGGYEQGMAEKGTIFDKFYAIEIGNPLGIHDEIDYQSAFYEMKNSLFYQNPAGSLANISYKKSILEKFEDVFDDQMIDYIELELKRVVMMSHEMCFSPIPVRRMDKMTLKKFKQREFMKGFTYGRFCQNHPRFKKYFKYSSLSLLGSVTGIIFNGFLRGRIGLSAVVFLAALYRWLGALNWKLLNFSSRLRKNLSRD